MSESDRDTKQTGEQDDGEGQDASREGTKAMLRPRERREAERRTTVRAQVVHAAILSEGQEELRRPTEALAWSGLAAGLSMGFSMATEGLLAINLPDASWAPAISSFGYSVGFLIVILGRQQLFTENTLTVVLPLLDRRDRKTFLSVARLWTVVLLANLLGTLIFAFGTELTAAFSDEARTAFTEIGRQTMQDGFWGTFSRAILAGWLIALMVWLLPTAHTEQLVIIVIITYIVALGNFAHVIAGSVESLYLVVSGDIGVGRYLGGFLAPAFLGNVIGGVALVSVINHAQVVSGRQKKQQNGSGADEGQLD